MGVPGPGGKRMIFGRVLDLVCFLGLYRYPLEFGNGVIFCKIEEECNWVYNAF